MDPVLGNLGPAPGDNPPVPGDEDRFEIGIHSDAPLSDATLSEFYLLPDYMALMEMLEEVTAEPDLEHHITTLEWKSGSQEQLDRIVAAACEPHLVGHVVALMAE